MISRGILDDSAVSPAHPSVLMLLSYWTDAMKAKEAIEIVRSSSTQFRLLAEDGAYKVAMVDHLFTQERLPGGQLKIRMNIPGIDEIEIPPDYWNDNEENQSRIADWNAPLPPRKPSHPIEQKVALIYTLLNQNALFAMRFVALLEASITNMMGDVMGAARKKQETDAEGFRSDTVGGNMDLPPDAVG